MTNDKKSQIVELVQTNPGIQYSELMRMSGMKNGVLSHHTRKLEQKGIISVQRTPRVTRYYPLGLAKEEIMLITNLRQETPRNILVTLLEEEPLSFATIVNKIKRSQSTVSLNLTQLIQDEIIESNFINLRRTFKIKNKELVKKTIGKYRPDIIEQASDRLGDIFSSL
jgi:predicted transcriptional regulator